MRRRPVGILALLAATSLVALAGGWTLMFYAAWTILFLLVCAYLLSIVGLRALYFDRRTRALRAEVGSYFDERIIVENRSWIPKLWLEIEDQGQHPEHTASFVVSLGPYGRFVRPVHTLCRQRGVFQLGPVFAESGDPFGLFRQRRKIDGASTLVVYPVALPLASFGRVDGELTGGALQGERVPHTTTNVSGVREYLPGDTFNRIHWKSTARQRQLMVKEFELDPFADIWLVLDLDQTDHGRQRRRVGRGVRGHDLRLARQVLPGREPGGRVRLAGTPPGAGPRHPPASEDPRSARVRTSGAKHIRWRSCSSRSSAASAAPTPSSSSPPLGRTAG